MDSGAKDECSRCHQSSLGTDALGTSEGLWVCAECQTFRERATTRGLGLRPAWANTGRTLIMALALIGFSCAVFGFGAVTDPSSPQTIDASLPVNMAIAAAILAAGVAVSEFLDIRRIRKRRRERDAGGEEDVKRQRTPLASRPSGDVN